MTSYFWKIQMSHLNKFKTICEKTDMIINVYQKWKIILFYGVLYFDLSVKLGI